jgi:hypothetical protein
MSRDLGAVLSPVPEFAIRLQKAHDPQVKQGTCAKPPETSTPDRHLNGDRCPLNLQERAMATSSPIPPPSIACDRCDHEMKLISVVPHAESTLYAYECANGHRCEVFAPDKLTRKKELARR